MIFIGILGAGKGTWNTIAGIIKSNEWKKSILITNSFGKQNFAKRFPDLKTELIEINEEQSIQELAREIAKKIEPFIEKEIDIAINIESGSGKLHTALLIALMYLGTSFRFVGIRNNELVEETISPYSLTE